MIVISDTDEEGWTEIAPGPASTICPPPEEMQESRPVIGFRPTP